MHDSRNRRAASPRPAPRPSAPIAGEPPDILARKPDPPGPPPRIFPADVPVPPHRGAVARTVDLAPLPAAAQAPAKVPTRRKKAPAGAKQPRKAKSAAAARQIGAPRPSGQKVTTPPAIALPHLAEPLVTPDPAVAQRPLPRHRALAPQRPTGLAAQIAWWLQGRAQTLSRLLAPRRKPVRRAAGQSPELVRLRQENERLRAQLEALLALRPEPAMPDT